MWSRLFVRAALIGLMLILPALARVADAQSGKPTMIVSLASYEELRKDFLYLASLAGQDEEAERFDRMVQAQMGDKGQQGFDLRKPAGAYAWVGRQGSDSSFVLLIPVTDPGAVLEMLANLGIAVDRADDGVFRAKIDTAPEPFYFRFANGYAYVTVRDRTVLDRDRLLPPTAILPDAPAGVLSMTLNIDRIPAEFKELALDDMSRELVSAREQIPPYETEWQRKFRLAGMDETARIIRMLLNDGGETSLRLDLDRGTGDVTLNLSVEGKPGSAMAAAILELGQARSATAGLLEKGTAMSGGFNISVSDKMRDLIGAALDDGQKQALAQASERERQAMASVFDAVMPTLKTAELDATVCVQGPGSDGLYAIAAAVKVRDGARLERLLRDTAALNPDVDIRFDAEKSGPVRIHRVTLKRMGDEVRRVLGGNPVYVAFRDDAVIAAVGVKGLGILKEALAVAPVRGKVVDLEVAVARLAPLADDRDRAAAMDIARRVFGDNGDDRLRLTVEGGRALKLELAMKAKLIEYASLLGHVLR